MHFVLNPTAAAFQPSCHLPSQWDGASAPLTEADHINEFFDLYRMEHRWLLENQNPGGWESASTACEDYLEYSKQHLLELTTS
ncbi:hypothetical protein J0A68_16505 [Algoriphagus sp. H41]|uniref:Uncharacterized protein n=1 Tax=Algoriphagus oliviformis TaxID=2811231 RepID=A0ABS3C614_9BACT|nr:hypothetical protein [Algoriphagus oliviformis]MBN7812557.1 hypothetical protein [Algoriphagus oliviformis]